jgi:hypothetical protein
VALFGGKRKQNPESETQGSEPQDPALSEKLLASLMAGGGMPAPMGPGVISNIDIAKLIEYIISEKPEAAGLEEALESKKDIEEMLQLVEKMSRDYTDIYARDGISRIYQPIYGSSIVDARLGQIAILLAKSARVLWNRVRKLIQENAPADDVYKAAKEAELFTQLSYLVLTESYSKLITLYFINAPPEARPPLVNASLGYELLRTQMGIGRERKR